MTAVSLSIETRLFLILGVVIGALCLGTGMEYSLQITLLALMIGLFGLPHGALDGLVTRQAGLWKNLTGLIAFHFVYLALVGLAIASWMLVPVASLLVFLIISGWHFGSDWRDSLTREQRLAAGLTIVCLPSVLHTEAVAEIYEILSGPRADSIALIQSKIGIMLLLVLIAVSFQKARRAPSTAIELIAIVILGLLLEPLYFFVVYFCGLHSPRHLLETWRVCAKLGRRTTAFWMLFNAGIALLAGISAYLMLRDNGMDAPLLTRIVFIGVAALTVPHMLLIELVNSKTTRD